jgi:hypothetical protein
MTYNDNNDGGGKLMIPILMFLIIACVIGQICFLLYLNYPHWFTYTRGIEDVYSSNVVDNEDITVDTTTKQSKHDKTHKKKKQDLDLFDSNNYRDVDVDVEDPPADDVPFVPPKMIRMSRRNSM